MTIYLSNPIAVESHNILSGHPLLKGLLSRFYLGKDFGTRMGIYMLATVVSMIAGFTREAGHVNIFNLSLFIHLLPVVLLLLDGLFYFFSLLEIKKIDKALTQDVKKKISSKVLQISKQDCLKSFIAKKDPFITKRIVEQPEYFAVTLLSKDPKKRYDAIRYLFTHTDHSLVKSITAVEKHIDKTLKEEHEKREYDATLRELNVGQNVKNVQ